MEQQGLQVLQVEWAPTVRQAQVEQQDRKELQDQQDQPALQDLVELQALQDQQEAQGLLGLTDQAVLLEARGLQVAQVV